LPSLSIALRVKMSSKTILEEVVAIGGKEGRIR